MTGDSVTRRDAGLGGYTPAPAASAPAASDDAAAYRTRRVAIFRWRGIVPLLVFLGVLALVWVVFGDRVVESTSEEAMTKLIGAQVEIDGLRMRSAEGVLEVAAIAIADPFDRRRNLVETGPLRVEIERVPLLEKKLVIRRLSLRGMRFGVPRGRLAPPAPRDGYTAQTLRELSRWRAQFQVPLLQLTPIDTIRSIVLSPTQLASVREASALRSRADSVRTSLDGGWQGLRIEETLDSARNVGRRLAGANVRTLGVNGTRQAIADVKRTLAELDSARRRIEALDREARAGATVLGQGLRGLDDARRRDYEFARRLLALPSFDGPAIGNALFGDVSIDRFQQAMYWAKLAERYMPPGLRPRESAGPSRLRASGTTVHFTKIAEYPSFLMRRADLSFELDDKDTPASTYSAAVVDVTSQPALVGRATRFLAQRRAAGTRLRSVRVDGTLDHVGAHVRDSVNASADGVTLPTLDLPGLPLRADLGRGQATLRFARDGDSVRALWTLDARQVQWQVRASSTASNRLEELVTRVVAGLQGVHIEAELTGALNTPHLSVRSNLDRAIGDRLRTVAGEELARAETKVRAKVDSLAEERVAPVRAQVAALRSAANQRVADARAGLDEERTKLEAQLKALGGGVLGLPRLPGT